MNVKIIHTKLADPLKFVHGGCLVLRLGGRQKNALGEMADGGFAPHCPLVAVS